MPHGITNNDNMFSVRQMPWHGLGVVLDEYPRSIDEALQKAGKAAAFVDAAHFGHMDMAESLGNPYGPNGRAVLAMMGLDTPPA